MSRDQCEECGSSWEYCLCTCVNCGDSIFDCVCAEIVDCCGQEVQECECDPA